MNYSVLRKFLSTTSLIAITATISACSGEMERWSSPGFEGYTPNQKEIFTNSTSTVPVQAAVNQQMPAVVTQAQQVRYQAPVYTAPARVPVVAAPINTGTVQTAVRTPVQSYPMPVQVASASRSVPVYSAVPVVQQTAAKRYPSANPTVDYTSTGSISSTVLNKPPVVVSSFSSLPKPAPRGKNPSRSFASVPAVATQRMPVSVPVAAQPMPPKPVQETSRFSIAKFFSLPKKAPKSKSIDYGTTASITPPAPIPTGTNVSVAPRQQVASAARTSGRWTSAGGSMITVRNGESIQILSRRYGVPSKAIADVNGLTDKSYVAPGQKILIPVYQQAGAPSYPAAVQQTYPAPVQQTAALTTPTYAVPTVMRVPTANPLRLQSQTPYGQQVIRMQQTANASRRHMVMPGDSLGGIASRYQVSVASLAKANGLTTNSRIRMGQRLHIPQPTSAGNGIDYSSTASINRQPLDMSVASNQAMPPMVSVSRIPKSKPRQAVQSSLAIMKSQPTGRVVVLPKAKRRRVAALKQPVGLPDGVKTDVSPKSATVTPSTRTQTPAKSVNAGVPKFRWPVRGRIISNYGRKRDGGRNDGINLSVPAGTSVRVAESGTVIYSGSKLKGYGNLVLVQHSNGWVTAYAHNDKVLVSKGQQVRRGQIISQAGKSGNVDSPQLHFELRIKGDPVDPVPYLIST